MFAYCFYASMCDLVAVYICMGVLIQNCVKLCQLFWQIVSKWLSVRLLSAWLNIVYLELVS